MIPAKVLLMSDDIETGQIWSYTLQQHGMETTLITLLDKDVVEPLPELGHDLIVIDVYSLQSDCAGLIRRLRQDITIPILLLGSSHDERYVLEVYEAGADEVIIKPISFKLFRAKINAWMRRSWTLPAAQSGSFEIGDLRLEPAQHQLIDASGTVIKLTGLEFRLLHLLMSHPGQVMESGLIIDRIWGAHGGDTALLKNLVYRLRQKIEPDPGNPRYVQVMSREGYLFTASQTEIDF